jgi:hypothetical protein
MHTARGAIFAAFFAAGLALSGAASAADDEGVIASIDREAGTITLENGNSYKLPVEFDMEALQEGMQILLAYDDVAGEKLVTDMEIE